MVNTDIRDHEKRIIRSESILRWIQSTFRPRLYPFYCSVLHSAPGAFRVRYHLGMNRFGILRAENHRKHPLNSADRNRNYVNLRSPRVEYRTSVRDRRCYGRTIFQPDWTIVTFYLRQPWEFVDDCRSQRQFPAWNGTSFTTSSIGRDDLPAVLIKRGILDAWIDYASYITGRCKASKSFGPR